MVCSILDNSPIQCSHGKVPISKVTCIKRLSIKAWDKLFSKVCASIVLSRILHIVYLSLALGFHPCVILSTYTVLDVILALNSSFSYD